MPRTRPDLYRRVAWRKAPRNEKSHKTRETDDTLRKSVYTARSNILLVDAVIYSRIEGKLRRIFEY